MDRNRIGVIDDQRDGVALERLLDKMAGACALCDDLVCLDCAATIAHGRCTRACPECAPTATATDATIDWDQAWQTTQLLTELHGLDRLDAAIRAL